MNNKINDLAKELELERVIEINLPKSTSVEADTWAAVASERMDNVDKVNALLEELKLNSTPDIKVSKLEAEVWASTAIQTMDTTFSISNFLQREDENKPLSKDEMKILVSGLRNKFTELGVVLESTPKTVEAMFEYDMSDEYLSENSAEAISGVYHSKVKAIKALEDPKQGSFTKIVEKK